jgi:iron-sulfur cluster assembly accessory protein
MIALSERAINKVKEISEDLGVGHYTVRIKCVGGGCSGYQHEMDFEDIIQDTDEVIETDGIKVVIDQMSWQYLENLMIDYQDKGIMGGGFTFGGPDIKSTRGCGSSVEY